LFSKKKNLCIPINLKTNIGFTVKGVKEDVRCMKETLKLENPNKISNEFFDFHEKVNTILEE
jgi:hypothetical protein